MVRFLLFIFFNNLNLRENQRLIPKESGINYCNFFNKTCNIDVNAIQYDTLECCFSVRMTSKNSIHIKDKNIITIYKKYQQNQYSQIPPPPPPPEIIITKEDIKREMKQVFRNIERNQNDLMLLKKMKYKKNIIYIVADIDEKKYKDSNFKKIININDEMNLFFFVVNSRNTLKSIVNVASLYNSGFTSHETNTNYILDTFKSTTYCISTDNILAKKNKNERTILNKFYFQINDSGYVEILK